MQYLRICIKYMDGNLDNNMHYCGCRHSKSQSSQEACSSIQTSNKLCDYPKNSLADAARHAVPL